MKIALLEMYTDDKMATGERARALQPFLQTHGHQVDVLAPSPQRLERFYRFRFSFWSRLKRRTLHRKTLPHLWDYIADELEPKIQAGNYDVVIARLQPVAYVLTRSLNCLKIFDSANIGFLETYHSWGADLSELEIDYRKEMAIYEAADYIFLHHELLTEFFKKYVYNNQKIMTVRMGCYASERFAAYSPNPRIVYAGSYNYIQDPFLLSLLSSCSPYPIDCYGGKDPNYSFLPVPLNYRGYQAKMDFLTDYQFGLITVSKDRLRAHSPSTKFAYYFSYGLPVLFPEWMQEGHTYEAAIPYNEENFAEQVERVARNENLWRRLSEAAKQIAESLVWDKVLQPVLEVLSLKEAKGASH
jgi:glycosyltransferase involved in cell wall biosynthesis